MLAAADMMRGGFQPINDRHCLFLYVDPGRGLRSVAPLCELSALVFFGGSMMVWQITPTILTHIPPPWGNLRHSSNDMKPGLSLNLWHGDVQRRSKHVWCWSYAVFSELYYHFNLSQPAIWKNLRGYARIVLAPRMRSSATCEYNRVRDHIHFFQVVYTKRGKGGR